MNNLQRINYIRKEKNKTIKILTDSPSKVQAVIDGKKLVMEGNYWDFHPGCHGIYKYGSFNSASQLANQIKKYYEKKSYNVVIKCENYNF